LLSVVRINSSGFLVVASDGSPGSSACEIRRLHLRP
jgi:hypothetical protein